MNTIGKNKREFMQRRDNALFERDLERRSLQKSLRLNK